jgi:nicotinate-nucleotide adenylyltransferase
VIVAVFGGSFNPPHVAHVLASALVLTTHEVDRLLVVPTFQHPFPKSLAPYDDRVTMCELAMAWLPRVEVSRVEETLGGESRTLRTLEHLAREHPDWKLRLVIGADILLESSKWFAFDRIALLAPPIVLGRKGIVGTAAPEPLLPDVSSTEVRSMIAEGRADELELLVPREVLAHIAAKDLYRDSESRHASVGRSS